MSDLFSSLMGGGVQRPNVVMNDGPLPGQFPSGMQNNAQRIDGLINDTSSLLGDSAVAPYAYGRSKHLSTQQSYLNVPHRVMKIIPKLKIPSAYHIDNHEMYFVDVSHPVDEGDVAFVLKMEPSSELARSQSYLEKIGISRNAINLFTNVSGVNYLLAGLQRALVDPDGMGVAWAHLCVSVGFRGDVGDLEQLVVDFVRRRCVPFGVVHGSERQGGLNETTGSPATWPVSFVATMVVDGNVKNLVNAWAMSTVYAGADLRFVLRKCDTRAYTLNHYYKGIVTETFESSEECYQLVPCVDDGGGVGDGDFGDSGCNWRYGWHVARSQVYMPRRPGMAEMDVNDDRTRLVGGVLEATFAPCFVDNDS